MKGARELGIRESNNIREAVEVESMIVEVEGKRNRIQSVAYQQVDQHNRDHQNED